jgi:tripartite-type tricarboxylate transporter receptor subunit TctC
MRRSALSILVTCAILAGSAHAQSYPIRPVRIITPFGPGNAGDIIPRALGPAISQRLKQNVVLDNRPGAGGNIASEIVAKANPDGYTLMFATIGTHGINVSLYSKLPYDPIKDFAPIGLVATSPNVLVVNPSVPAQSVKDLIALAKAKPGALNFGSSGSGTSVHLSGELFNSLAGVKTIHVPYKGAVDSLNDLMGERLQFIFASLSSSIQFVKSGRLRGLAVTSPQRHPSIPELPTMIEAGVPGFEAVAWYGYVAPAATPKPIIERWNQVLLEVLNTPEAKDNLLKVGVDATSGTPEAFAKFIREEIDKWAKVVKASSARVD